MARYTDLRRRRGIVNLFGHSFTVRHFAMIAAFAVVFIVSAAALIAYGVGSARRKMNAMNLSAQYEQAFVGEIMETSAPEQDEAQVEIPVQETAAQDAGIKALAEQEMQQSACAPQVTLAPCYHDFSGDVPEKAMNLYKQNKDLVGWLYIGGVVSAPVVQRDNTYYLTHDFFGEENDGGALFLDENHPMAPETQHLLIHGHNMYDSSMFGIVGTYFKQYRVMNDGFATFSTMFEAEKYVICAVLRVSAKIGSPRYFNFMSNPTFISEEEFYRFTQELKERSMFEIPIDIQPSDGLLSLATCIDNDRLLVVFRRIREGETTEQLQALLDNVKKK